MQKTTKENQKRIKFRKILSIFTLILTITLVFKHPTLIYATGNTEQAAKGQADGTKTEDSRSENRTEDSANENAGKNAEENAGDGDEEAEEEKPIVVVIDPGHGGKNTGAICDEYIEKEITLKTALAMKRELEKYEGIEVYLTREDDADMELTKRTAYAVEVEADFFICLHYNMSQFHKLYGAECWISSYGECYAKGMDLAKIEMEMLTELGLYDRGVKTRHNSKGTDYYGVIRSSTANGIPSILIEHCHLDQENDKPFMDADTWPKKYGVLDATAVARYFGLKSEILGVDYSNDSYEKTPVPDGRKGPDTTPPEWCKVTDFSVDEEKRIATGKISAYDPDSRILYYTASFNYGGTYHEYYRFEPDENGEVEFEIPLPKNTRIRMVMAALNMYGGMAKSDILYMGTITVSPDEEQAVDDQNGEPVTDTGSTQDGPSDLGEDADRGKSGRSYLILAICLFVLCFPIILYYILWRKYERERIKRIKRRKMEYRYEKDEKRELETELEARERERVELLLSKKSTMQGKEKADQKEDESRR